MNHRKHNHHKSEMEHHKMREHHKAAHEKLKSSAYDHHPSMIDNRMVKDNHQQGIQRVLQRKGDMEVGQHGKMGAHRGGDSFKRPDSAKSPRRA